MYLTRWGIISPTSIYSLQSTQDFVVKEQWPVVLYRVDIFTSNSSRMILVCVPSVDCHESEEKQ